MSRRLFSSILAVALVVVAAPIASAQDPEQQLTIEVVRQPVWHGPNDELGITVRLTNTESEPIPGYRVTVAVHSRVLSRSELHASFDQPPPFEASLITAVDAADKEIGAGDNIDVVLNDPVSTLQSLAETSESGVFPLTISAFAPAGTLLGATTTQLLYYPSPPEFRLPTVPIVPIADLPRRGPDGVFESEDGETFPLDEAVLVGGWLRGLVTALDRATTPPPPEREGRSRGNDRRNRRTPTRPPPLRAGLVVMPRLAEELADMADGYRRGDDERVAADSGPSVAAQDMLEEIQAITARESVQPMLAPYSFTDLPTLFDLLDDEDEAREHLKQQILQAEVVLANTVEDSPSRSWIYTPGARMNLASLEGLQSLDAAEFALFAQESLEPLEDPAGGGCPEPPLSFTCAVTVATGEGRSTGYVFDNDLQARVGGIAHGDDGRMEVQRFFAELAMIKEELPSRTDRVVAFALPGWWEPPPARTRLILQGLRQAPFLRTYTPGEGVTALETQIKPFERRIRSVTPRLTNAPDSGYAAEVARADSRVESFRGVQPPPGLLERLARNTLVSESRLWWNDPTRLIAGERYATDAADEAEREMAKISIGGTDEISLTSSEAQLPIVVFNDAAYDVSVNVEVRSTELRLDETFPVTVQANGLRQLTVDVAAQSSGIGSVFIEVQAPDGHEIATKRITVRSTAFNEVALGLTFGALAFLILFYVTRAIRTRRSAEDPEE